MNVILRRESEPGSVVAMDRFPFVIGRSSDDLAVRGPGVWEKHAVVDQGELGELQVTCRPETTIQSNGMPVRHLRLKLGDTFQVGVERFRLELAAVPQRQSRPWEVSVVTLAVGVLLVELWLALGWLAAV